MPRPNRRYRAIQVRRVEPRRPFDPGRNRELLAVRATLAGRDRSRFFRDTQAMIVQLEAGAIDAITLPLRLRTSCACGQTQLPGSASEWRNRWYNVGMNLSVPPFDNKLVRQAMNYAIDRNRFVESVLLGIGAAQDLPWADSSPALNRPRTSAIRLTSTSPERCCRRPACRRSRRICCRPRPTRGRSLRRDVPGGPRQNRRHRQHRQHGHRRVGRPGQQPQVPQPVFRLEQHSLAHSCHPDAVQRQAARPEQQQFGLQERRVQPS